MRLPGRMSAAIEVLDDIETFKRPASEALREWGVKHRFAGAGDRAAIGNFVYDALRRRSLHTFLMQEASSRALVLSVAVRDWGEDPLTLQSTLQTEKFAPDPLSDEELARLTAPLAAMDPPPHISANIPDWTQPFFEEAFGASWHEEAAALSARPPLDMRVNEIKGSFERAFKSLDRFHPEHSALTPLAVRLAPGTRDARTPNVTADEAYRKGWVEIQDLGSQIVSTLIDATPGDQVLDYCAGGGGKTLAMAGAMQNKGQIFAYDAERSRLAPIYDRLKRAGAHNVQVCPPAQGVLDNLLQRMDKVVVDAPCTGSGTWRRRPDAKWRLSPNQLETRQSEQAKILRMAARYVKTGGELIYITCSLFPTENAEQVRRFLAEMSGFKAMDMRARWTRILPPNAPVPKWFGSQGGMLTPASTGTDGFFIAVLQKQKDEG